MSVQHGELPRQQRAHADLSGLHAASQSIREWASDPGMGQQARVCRPETCVKPVTTESSPADEIAVSAPIRHLAEWLQPCNAR